MTDILKCTIKKSVDVVKKLVLAVSYAVVAGTTITISIYGIVGIWQAIQNPLHMVVSFLSGIPWYYYAGIVAIAAVPVYSFLWCVARELTEDDWESEEARWFATAVIVVAIVAIAVVSAAAAAVIVAVVATIAVVSASAAAAAVDSKALLFVGALLHYRKRIKQEQHP